MPDRYSSVRRTSRHLLLPWPLFLLTALAICGLVTLSTSLWWSAHPPGSESPSGSVSVSTAARSMPTRATVAPPVSLTPRPTSQAKATTVVPAPLPTGMASRAPANSSTPVSNAPDFAALQRLMFDLVNTDRRAANLAPVAWDDFAAQVGAAHAQEMAQQGYMSHWNLQGYGPDVRHSLAGGVDAVMENVYMYWFRYDDGRPAPIQDWQKVIRDAEMSLMNSPGHRANILDPDHTHVGIGIAYNAQTGDVRIAQEFINHYIMLDSLPRQAHVGDTLDMTGVLLPGVSEPLINLAYESFPQPLTVDDLTNGMPGTYQSPAEFFKAINPAVSSGRFTVRVTLDHKGQSGLYHVRVWVKVKGRDVAASDVVIVMR